MQNLACRTTKLVKIHRTSPTPVKSLCERLAIFILHLVQARKRLEGIREPMVSVSRVYPV